MRLVGLKKLNFISAGGEGLTHLLQEGTLTLGEGKGCDVTFFNQDLDDHHAEITYSSTGVRVRDLDTRLGTFVNGVRVMDAFLQHGDRLMFGRLESVYDAGEDLRMLGGKALPSSLAPPHARPTLEHFHPSGDQSAIGEVGAEENIHEKRRLLGGLESVILKRQSELGKVGEQRKEAEEALRMLLVRKQELEAHVGELEKAAQTGIVVPEVSENAFAMPHEFASAPHGADFRMPKTLHDLEKLEGAMVQSIDAGGALADAHTSLFSRPAGGGGKSEDTIVSITGKPIDLQPEPLGVGILDVLDLAAQASLFAAPWSHQSESEEIPPVGWYAAARATGGQVHVDVGAAILSTHPLLVLCNGDWEGCLQAIGMVRAGGRRVFLGWSGGSSENLARSLKGGAGFQRLRYLCSHIDGVLTLDQTTRDQFISLVGADRCHLLPTPCPIDRPGWNFSIPQSQRKGIFLGDGGLDPENPDSLLYLDFLLDLASFSDTTISVIGDADHPAWKAVQQRSARLNILPVPEGYQEFLRVLGSHRLGITVSSDLRHGNLVGDALLCRSVALSMTSDAIAQCFSDLKDPFDPDVGVFITRILKDEQFYEQLVENAQRRALETVSYSVFRESAERLLSAGGDESAAV